MLVGIAFIVIILLIIKEIGSNSTDKDYNSIQYHADWDKEYHKWKMCGVSDSTARANSFKKVQEDKKKGKYDK